MILWQEQKKKIEDTKQVMVETIGLSTNKIPKII